MKYALIVLAFGLLVSLGRAGEEPKVIEVFPGKVPGDKGEGKEDKITGKKPTRRVEYVGKPTLSVYRPTKEKDTGIAIIVAPGGGYNILAWDHEGEDVATWLNKLGISAFVLKYRIPVAKGESRDTPSFPPLQDAQRAISLVRSNAKEWGIDPKKVGMLGFSAGGHLTAMTMTNFDRRGYDVIDDVDRASCRPDFAVLIYPGGVVKGDQLAPAIRVSKDTPPAFLAHCSDDKVSSENSAVFYLALKRAAVPAEMHLYAKGGHGFGMRPGPLPVAQWPRRCEEWLRAQGILQAAERGIDPPKQE